MKEKLFSLWIFLDISLVEYCHVTIETENGKTKKNSIEYSVNKEHQGAFFVICFHYYTLDYRTFTVMKHWEMKIYFVEVGRTSSLLLQS